VHYSETKLKPQKLHLLITMAALSNT